MFLALSVQFHSLLRGLFSLPTLGSTPISAWPTPKDGSIRRHTTGDKSVGTPYLPSGAYPDHPFRVGRYLRFGAIMSQFVTSFLTAFKSGFYPRQLYWMASTSWRFIQFLAWPWFAFMSSIWALCGYLGITTSPTNAISTTAFKQALLFPVFFLKHPEDLLRAKQALFTNFFKLPRETPQNNPLSTRRLHRAANFYTSIYGLLLWVHNFNW